MPYDSESSSTQENGAVKTIIVVEDDEDIGSFLVQAILQETNYQAMLLTDGFQCLKAVTSIKPNLFILDYHLPSMNGIEMYDQIIGGRKSMIATLRFFLDNTPGKTPV